MNVDLTIMMPEVFDIAHIILALLCSILLVCVVVLRTPKGSDLVKSELPTKEQPVSSAVQLKEMDGEGALHLLSLFQNEARLVDFIREDVAQFSDSDIGAAARVVHKGLRQVFDEHFTAEAVLFQEEGDTVSIESGFQPQEIQLLGNIVGDAPFKGTLVHQGWRVTDIRLPKTVEGRNSRILAAAQVEL